MFAYIKYNNYICIMNTFEIVHYIIELIGIIGTLVGVCKIIYMLGKNSGKQDMINKHTEKSIKDFQVVFMTFSAKIDKLDTKINSQNTSIAKLETKVDNIEKKLDK